MPEDQQNAEQPQRYAEMLENELAHLNARANSAARTLIPVVIAFCGTLFLIVQMVPELSVSAETFVILGLMFALGTLVALFVMQRRHVARISAVRERLASLRPDPLRVMRRELNELRMRIASLEETPTERPVSEVAQLETARQELADRLDRYAQG